MAEQFKDGLEHLPLRERIAARAKAVAEMAAELTGTSPGRPGDMDTLRDKLNETTELAKLLFEQQFIRHGGRKPADPEWSDLDESERDEWWDRALDAGPLIEAARRSSMFAAVSGYQLAEKDMDLLLWLHAEATWQMDRGASELARWRSGQSRKSWPVVESVPDGIHYAAELARAQGTEGGDEHDRLLREAAVRLRDLNDAARVLIADRDRERSSRQAWAEEALKMETIADRVLTFFSQHDDRLAFVSRRYQQYGSGANFRRNRCTGVSADALAWFAVGRRDEPKRSEYPLDPSDLAACQRTYDMAPKFLQERMEPVLARYRAAVAERYPDVEVEVARPTVHPMLDSGKPADTMSDGNATCTVHPDGPVIDMGYMSLPKEFHDAVEHSVHPEQAAAPGPDRPVGSPEGHFRPDPQMGQQQPESTSVHPDGGAA